MRSLIALLLMTVADLATAGQPQPVIDVQHDSHRQVTCWITVQGGISCLPDSQLQRQQVSAIEEESSTCAKSQVGAAVPTKTEQVFQL